MAEQQGVPPILRTKLHDEVLRSLRSLILRGELAPGSRVHERNLCEQLEISRTPLREALKVLASNGLVELLPNRGARIAPLSASDVAENLEVLALLERWAGMQAARLLSDAALQELHRLHCAMLAYSHAHDAENQLRVDLRIHRMIVEAAGNKSLATVHEGLASKVERARYLASIAPERVRQSMAEHEAIIRVLLVRDAAGVAETFYAHCQNTKDAVVEAVHSYLAAREIQAA